jgi:hypothetical protein
MTTYLVFFVSSLQPTTLGRTVLYRKLRNEFHLARNLGIRCSPESELQRVFIRFSNRSSKSHAKEMSSMHNRNARIISRFGYAPIVYSSECNYQPEIISDQEHMCGKRVLGRKGADALNKYTLSRHAVQPSTTCARNSSYNVISLNAGACRISCRIALLWSCEHFFDGDPSARNN